MKLNWFDWVIEPFAPRLALKRGLAREMIARAYDGAAVGRGTQGWKAPSTSADAEISRALPRLRDRSRDLTRNNPHARKALTVWTNNLVGAGIIPQAKHQNEQVNAKAMELWDKWSKQADADGQLNVYGLMELAVREMVEGG